VVLLMLFVTGCASVEYIPVDLSDKLPPDLTVDDIPSDEELECVADSTYQKVFKLYQRTVTLTDIILSTKQ
jgi:hypothetical protein